MKKFIEKYGTTGASLVIRISAMKLEDGSQKSLDAAKLLREIAADLEEELKVEALKQ